MMPRKSSNTLLLRFLNLIISFIVSQIVNVALLETSRNVRLPSLASPPWAQPLAPTRVYYFIEVATEEPWRVTVTNSYCI